MIQNKNKTNKDNLDFLSNFDDQYNEILDNVELDESTDSETTDLLNFRVLNSNNPYPQKDCSTQKK